MVLALDMALHVGPNMSIVDRVTFDRRPTGRAPTGSVQYKHSFGLGAEYAPEALDRLRPERLWLSGARDECGGSAEQGSDLGHDRAVRVFEVRDRNAVSKWEHRAEYVIVRPPWSSRKSPGEQRR